MKRRLVIIAAALAYAGAALAQPVDDAAINAFVGAHTVPTRIGRIARWDDPICVSVEGLPASFSKFIAQRVATVATAAGAKMDADGCKANVNVIFTTKPQALLDSIRAANPVMIGYFDSTSQAEKMATVTHPIQAWYVTKTVDLRGKWKIDTRYANSVQTYDAMDNQASAGTRTGDGLRSAFYHVTVVGDPGKLGDHEIGALADNIAMLALSQPGTLDNCSALPSIVNLSLTGCAAGMALTGMSANDTAFLYGLYHMQPGGTLGTQLSGVTFGMKEKMAAK
jgi:hypothetical protein